jgi:hypothetical protein
MSCSKYYGNAAAQLASQGVLSPDAQVQDDVLFQDNEGAIFMEKNGQALFRNFRNQIMGVVPVRNPGPEVDPKPREGEVPRAGILKPPREGKLRRDSNKAPRKGKKVKTIRFARTVKGQGKAGKTRLTMIR